VAGRVEVRAAVGLHGLLLPLLAAALLLLAEDVVEQVVEVLPLARLARGLVGVALSESQERYWTEV
jgi:hypothetical protein